MIDLDKWQEIWLTISHNKMRSVMTAFGVFWGIFMLVVMSGAGGGLEHGIMGGMKDFAQNSCYFFNNRTSEAYDGLPKGRWWNMHTSDMQALKEKFPEIKSMSAIVFGWSSGNNTKRNDKYGSYSLLGVSPEYQKMNPQIMKYGRYINDMDVRDKRKVCIIGTRVYSEMFAKDEDPVGKIVEINSIPYRVIGVNIPTTRANIGGNPEQTILFPYSTMQQSYHMGDNIHCIAIAAHDRFSITALEQDIQSLIKKRNRISPTDVQALQSFNMEKEFKMWNSLFLGISLLVWIVGAGTLIAGIVGVSNIMLVTIKERTKEIGIRRALGAQPRSIITQILNESLVLTLFAGFLGLGAGVGILQLADMLTQKMGDNSQFFFKSPQISFTTAVTATCVLIIAGLLAGWLPARKAMQIKAIDAIREE